MNNETKKTIIFSIPTMIEKDWQFLQAIRLAYDPENYIFIKPHFTYFSAPNYLKQDELIKCVHSHTNHIAPFSFIIKKAVLMPPSLEHKSWYVFLIPDDGSAFQQIYSHIIASCTHLSVGALPFLPHITVGTFSNQTDGMKLVNYLNGFNKPLRGLINEISFANVYRNQINVFNHIVLKNMVHS